MVHPGPSSAQQSVRQCELVRIARSSYYYDGKGESPLNLKLMKLIDERFLDRPYYGQRQMARWLRTSGPYRRPQEGATPDAQDGPDADLPGASDDGASSAAPDLSVPSAQPGDHAAEPGVVRRHHVHPDAPGLLVPGGRDGLVDPGGPVLATEQYDVPGLLCGSARGGAVALWHAGDFQYRFRGASSPVTTSLRS